MLPLIDRPIDSTALADYMTCPRKYYYGMVLHRRGKGHNCALTFGTAWHKALEIHYKTNGEDPELVAFAAQESWPQDWPADMDDYRTLARALLDYQKYRKQFGEPAKEQYRTIGWPDSPLIEISTQLEGGGLLHPYAGKLDRIVEDENGMVWVMDHKTTSRFDKYYFMQFKLSQQMMGYTWMAQQLLPNRKVQGVVINLSHVLTNKTEFHREAISFSTERIKEWVHNTNAQARRLHTDYLLQQEQGPAVFPGDGIAEAFPGHYGDNGCSSKFGMCQYKDVCQAGPRIRKAVLEQEYIESPWNPLETDD